MSKLIQVISGPNLNLLGARQPELYGSDTLDDVAQACTDVAEAAGMSLRSAQSNSEGALVDLIQACRNEADGIVINAGAYSHTSIAILDALHMFDGPVLEVHVSNIFRREKYRHFSYVTECADGIIAGFGAEGYALAVRRMVSLLS